MMASPNSLKNRRKTKSRAAMIELQVFLPLPGRHFKLIIIPLKPLGAQEALDDVRAERLADHLVFLQLVQGIFERGGQGLHTRSPLRVQVQVLVGRLGRRQLAADAVQPGRQHRGEG